jgi:uncharacterized membrane protein SpoIIM required for sporulation
MLKSNGWSGKRSLVISAFMVYGGSFLIGFLLAEFIPLGVKEDYVPITDPLIYMKHNSMTILLFLSGIFTFGLTSFYALFLNGLILGASFYELGSHSTYGLALLHIVPHGLFEVPAMVLAGAVGLYPIQIIMRYMQGAKLVREGEWKVLFFMTGCVFVFVMVAGTVEAWVTPLFVFSFNSIPN